MNADLIYVMDKSVILESGTYASPMALGGTYTEFVAKQQLKTRGTDIEAPEYEANPTGCEKSTVIALLERWYDVNGGQVAVDKYNIRVLQLYNIREHIALVGQGPVLFDMSIKDNILYGLPNSVKAQERWSRWRRLPNYPTSTALSCLSPTDTAHQRRQGISAL
jgi:ABC-type multidrug transport system fused ATPase/permease subunit